ncbi:SIS domain-containing protein [Pseudonocardia xishanensis]|uniref:Glutamine--fructose-6-phosphate aminotransferase [isomerizing] n=1 Tax=Pseudonocardia xishanensis TaxID=630995 RepID=A0ABP8RZV7_9PSEU
MTHDFNLDRQIASAPNTLQTILDAVEIPELDPARPVLFTGIGTSLHAARIAADWVSLLTGGQVRARAVDAHDIGTWAPIRSDEQVVVISHRGTKIFPTAALRRAAEAGASTVAIVGETAPEQPAEHTLRACANETAGTFTVSYLSSLTVLAALVAPLDRSPDRAFAEALGRIPQAVADTLKLGDPAKAAAQLVDSAVLLLIGFGIDLPTAQEAALKIKEGAWMWTEAMSPEFALHGTPASYRPDMAAVLLEPTFDDGGRTERLREVVSDLGLRTLDVGAETEGPLAFTAPHPLLRPITAIVPLQRLTAELARLRGTNPDTMHGGRDPWERVMTGIRL